MFAAMDDERNRQLRESNTAHTICGLLRQMSHVAWSVCLYVSRVLVTQM